MSKNKKDWLKKLDPSKIEDIEFKDITEHKHGSVNEIKAKDDISQSQKIKEWTEEKESRLKSLTEEVNLETNKLKELERAIKKISPLRKNLETKTIELSFVDKKFKEIVNDQFKSKKIGEVYECSVTGKGDYLIFKLDSKTTGIFKSRKKIESEVISRDGKLVIKNHLLINNRKFKETDFFRKELENFLEKIKTDIENQESNYIDGIKIERGILQVRFGLGKETLDLNEKKLEELEQEKQAIELLLVEKNKLRSALLEEKWKMFNEASEEKNKKEFNIKEITNIPLIAKTESRILKCKNGEDFKNLLENLRNEGIKLTTEEQKRWEDVLPILDLSKEEIIGIISLWKDWSKNEMNLELKKWSQNCIDILGKVMNKVLEEEKANKQPQEKVENNTNTGESSTSTLSKTIESDKTETKILESNKKTNNEEIKKPDDNEYIYIKYNTENYEIYLISMNGLRNRINDRLKEKLEMRRINLKETNTNTTGDGFGIKIFLEEDSPERKKISGGFEIINEKNKILVREIKNEKNNKLIEVLMKDIREEIKKIISETIESIKKKERREFKLIRISGESFEIIFEKSDENKF